METGSVAGYGQLEFSFKVGMVGRECRQEEGKRKTL